MWLWAWCTSFCLTRGVSWTDAEIKTNILETTMRHGHFIKWSCDLSDPRPHCICFILGYRCIFKKEEPIQTLIPLLWWESYHFVGQKDPVERNLLSTTKKKLDFLVFILYCHAINFMTVSVHLWHTSNITIFELTCFRLHTFNFMFYLIYLFLYII